MPRDAVTHRPSAQGLVQAFALVALVVGCEVAASRPGLCLSMIVRDEAHNIKRCLTSVKPIIDSYSISDTGSTDDTPRIVKETLSDLPGTLSFDKWVDFSHNRNIALSNCRDEYALTIDADETLVLPEGYRLPILTADAYHIEMKSETNEWMMTHIVKLSAGFKYVDVLHEYLHSQTAAAPIVLPDVYIKFQHDGYRASDPATYEKDAALLEEALRQHPNHTRYAFYLANSYRDARNTTAAIDAYRRHIAMSGTWYEEVCNSYFHVGRLRTMLGDPIEAVASEFLAAYNTDPTRPEALFEVARLHMYGHADAPKRYNVAALYLDRVLAMPTPSRLPLFYNPTVLAWRAKLERAVAAYYQGNDEMAVRLNRQLLADSVLSEHTAALVRSNIQYSLDRMPGPPRATSHGALHIAIAEVVSHHPFDPDSVKTGLGGSEEAVVYAAAQLAKDGHSVVVFGYPPDNSKWRDSTSNPRYVSIHMRDTWAAKSFDVALMWRSDAFWIGARLASKVYLWSHDIPMDPISLEHLTGVFYLSTYHREAYFQNHPALKHIPSVIAGNGVPLNIGTKQNRVRHSCIYASNYARGLLDILQAWLRILAEVPDATLEVYYGRETYQQETDMEQIVSLLGTLPGVTEHSMVGHSELADAYERASVFAYPCNTGTETFCITAIKAQLGGAIPAVIRRGALFETVSKDAPEMEYGEDYADFLIRVLLNEDEYDRNVFREFGRQYSWEEVTKKWMSLISAGTNEHPDSSSGSNGDAEHEEL